MSGWGLRPFFNSNLDHCRKPCRGGKKVLYFTVIKPSFTGAIPAMEPFSRRSALRQFKKFIGIFNGVKGDFPYRGVSRAEVQDYRGGEIEEPSTREGKFRSPLIPVENSACMRSLGAEFIAK